VIGAGAAGLTAAAGLSRAGRSVLLIEARDRIGGRCFTRRLPGLSVPVELGAEFIHGRPDATLALLEKAGVDAVESTRTQRLANGGRLEPVEAFLEAQKATRDSALLAEGDLTFDAFLAKQKLPRLTKTLARMMVQGFDAADPAEASARAIVEEWGGDELGESQMRPAGGYGPLLETLSDAGTRLQLQTVVREVRWKRGSVKVRGDFLGTSFSAEAPRAIVTLPLGVLQSKAVRFIPPLAEKRNALRKLASGPVIRVALRFEKAFWQERFPDVAFFHSPQAPFPSFWTPLPMRVPLLTAWAGGPKAARLTGAGEANLVRHALASVASVFGKRTLAQARLAAALVQDWHRDPYARGGYSYVTVGGEGAREQLAAPLADTLFFAGEATDSDGEAGTVAGALQSGMRAVRELMQQSARRDAARAP
jgi:monoamine oxidase